jgi:3'-5' exonuclease
MATLVFDIETSALPVDQFDELQLEYLYREVDATADTAEQDRQREQITNFFSLWPLTAQTVCIGMLNAETERGQVLYIAEDHEAEPAEHTTVKFDPCVDEGELLGSFWDIAKHYKNIVTFNGRGFDVPFLYLRSAILNIPITQKNWLGYRFQTEPHCDLAEQLTFYGVSGRTGAARRFNLDFYCKSFGIQSPKSQEVSGQNVTELLAAGKYQDIADYCVRDVVATKQLFQIWSERLKGIK